MWTLLVDEEGEIPHCWVYAYCRAFSWNSFGGENGLTSGWSGTRRYAEDLCVHLEWLTDGDGWLDEYVKGGTQG